VSVSHSRSQLVARGKHPNVAVIAIARELAAFVWDIARMTSPTPDPQPHTH